MVKILSTWSQSPCHTNGNMRRCQMIMTNTVSINKFYLTRGDKWWYHLLWWGIGGNFQILGNGELKFYICGGWHSYGTSGLHSSDYQGEGLNRFKVQNWVDLLVVKAMGVIRMHHPLLPSIRGFEVRSQKAKEDTLKRIQSSRLEKRIWNQKLNLKFEQKAGENCSCVWWEKK